MRGLPRTGGAGNTKCSRYTGEHPIPSRLGSDREHAATADLSERYARGSCPTQQRRSTAVSPERDTMPWVRRLASVGATWIRALAALPRDEQQAVLIELEAQLERPHLGVTGP
jgi:hypothetical protein